MQIRLPAGLAEQRELGPDWADWLDRLPALFAEMLDDWHLDREDGQLWHGFCSLVAPVRTAEGEEAVLKVSFDGDDESAHEAQTLKRHPDLHGRELTKLTALGGVVAQALRERGVAEADAVLAAETGMTVFRLAFAAWLREAEERPLAQVMTEELDRLQRL